ncbi:MAG: PAS domain S-box protein, partial [Anaerolineales bacterium]|nr:PAS domain S-box protein [Anaerolineales bacterium]
MSILLRALIIEDSEDDTLFVLRTLRKGGYDPIYERVETAEEMDAALRKHEWDVVLADYSLPHFNAPRALEQLKNTSQDLPFIVISGTVGEDIAVEVMKAGAHDFFIKGNLTRLVSAIEREIREAAIRQERKRKDDELKQIEWLLTRKPELDRTQEYDHNQFFGDLAELNTCRVILDSVGEQMLNDIVSDYLSLLDTSAAVYEKNGDYALRMVSSDWCRFMNQASRKLCGTEDTREAQDCGKWLCHESCWTQASKVSIETGTPVNIECNGGINIYAVPILAGDEIVGSINFGYGDPPCDKKELQKLAEKYEVNLEALNTHSAAYESRPPYIIELAKYRLRALGRLIGEIVARKQAMDREQHLSAVLRAVRNVNQLITKEDDKDRLINSACSTLIETLGYSHAWIALIDSSGAATALAQSSANAEATAEISTVLGHGELPHCARRAIISGVAIAYDPVSDCKSCTLKEAYAGCGGLATRLEYNDTTYGVIVISLPVEHLRDEEEQALFLELASDLGFALWKIEMTDRRRELERRNAQYARIVANTQDAMALVDRNYVFQEVNSSYAKLHDMTVEDLKGCSIKEVMGEEFFRNTAKPRFDRCLAGEEVKIETTVETPGTGVRFVSALYSPCHEPDGTTGAAAVCVHDITDLYQAQREIEQLARFTFENPNPVLRISVDGNILYANNPAAAALEIMGLGAEGKIDNKWQFQIRAAMETGQPRQEEIAIGDAVFEATFAPILELGYVNIYMSDISERKRMEEALRDSEVLIRAVMDNLPVGVAVNLIDPSVEFIYMNDNFIRFYRTTREALTTEDAFWESVFEDPEFREQIKKQ